MRTGLGDIGDEGTAEEAVVAPLREGKGAPRFVLNWRLGAEFTLHTRRTFIKSITCVYFSSRSDLDDQGADAKVHIMQHWISDKLEEKEDHQHQDQVWHMEVGTSGHETTDHLKNGGSR